MNWTAAFRALIAGNDERSPAHILSAATRKDRDRERRNATTNAMRASLGLEGRL